MINFIIISYLYNFNLNILKVNKNIIKISIPSFNFRIQVSSQYGTLIETFVLPKDLISND